MPKQPLKLDPPLSARLRFTGGVQSAGRISEDHALMARSFAYLFGFGGTLLLLTLLLPGAEDRQPLPLIAIAAIAYAVSALCILGYDRLPRWLLAFMPLAGNVLIAGVLLFGGDRGVGAYAVYFFWVALAAFYFFGIRYAVFCSAVSCATFAAVIAFHPGVGLGPLRVVMLSGGLFVAGILVGRLRLRADRLVEQLADAARTDVLTGLANRREFEMRLRDELARAARRGGELSLIALDLDGLKPINDHHGHHAGDLVLQRVATALRAECRETDTLARIGGDEFALIVPEVGQAGAYLASERLREMVGAAFERDRNRVTLCAGIAVFDRHGETAQELTEAADRALYSAKRLGGDCSVIYNSEVATTMDELGLQAAPRELPSSLEAVVSLAQAVDVRQMGSARHSQTVGRYAEAMGIRLGMSEEADAERMRLAGVLHDIGKISIAGSILTKPGPLDERELEEMRRHPEIGARIARNAQLDEVADWIAAHHERPDGRGYPQGLRAEAIPLEARILAVADAFEAMTNDRPYRGAMSTQAACEELRKQAGAQFDAQVVAIFLQLVSERQLASVA